MTDEILKDELLTDEQLDDVAGGNIGEIVLDLAVIAKVKEGNGSLNIKDQNDLRREWAKFGVATVYYDDKTPNEYYIDGNQVSRSDAVKHLLTVSGHPEYIKTFVK
ncbi:MAG: hypothetical protein IKP64_13015 [Selenomonadaceae bacterium]|nr:hypothetical protein [Selenomonadaceae bacterium]MBR4384464.1 hypothetical protein [Selenomonadaceae bacterium]